MFAGKVVIFQKKWLCSGKSGCIRAEEVVFVKKWLHSGKVVVFGKIGFIQTMWFYSGKVVVFGKKEVYSSMSCCIRARWLYSRKVIVFG